MKSRSDKLHRIRTEKCWDVVVIGGGATGLFTAWEACSRGLNTLLVESYDYTSSTSSRSTKLIHGGVRYLQNLELGLVTEALRERHTLLNIAPEFCQSLRFTLPVSSRLKQCYYRLGLGLYDLLACSSSGWESAQCLSKEALHAQIPGLKSGEDHHFKAGVSYTDAQFDDCGLAVALSQVINNNGGVAINYMALSGLKEDTRGNLHYATVTDRETNESIAVRSKIFINATGAMAEQFEQVSKYKISASRGSHIVVNKAALGGDNAMIIPKTSDGRVLFAIPWLGHTVIGTTDVATTDILRSPEPSPEEIEFLLSAAQRHLGIEQSDILSKWAGLRPLVRRANRSRGSTKSISRKHIVEISRNGLVTIMGGKWTTARAMAQDAIDSASRHFSLAKTISRSATLNLVKSGAMPPLNPLDQDPKLVLSHQDVKNAIHHYEARTIASVLARRYRTVFLDSVKAVKQAEQISHWMAVELEWSEAEREDQLRVFNDTVVSFCM